MATAAIKTNKSASLAIRIEAIRTGSRTAAVTIRATAGGRLPRSDLDFGFAGWVFNEVLAYELSGYGFLTSLCVDDQFQSAETPAALLIVDNCLE